MVSPFLNHFEEITWSEKITDRMAEGDNESIPNLRSDML